MSIESIKRDIRREIESAKMVDSRFGTGHPKVEMAADRMEHLLKYIDVLEKEHTAFLSFTRNKAYVEYLSKTKEEAEKILKEQGYDIE